MPPRIVLFCASLVVVALASPLGCSGDHDRLAKEDTTSAGGFGGTGGDDDPTTTSSSGGTGGAGGIVEPPGPTTLTVVNGVVDRDTVRFCFEAYPAANPGTLPWPGVEGLPYARGTAVDTFDTTIPQDDDVEVIVVSGDLGATGGESCETLVSAPPVGVDVFSVGILPASVFDEEKSLLLVAAGCHGGPGHTHEMEESVCGLGYSETRPNPTIVAGFMSRLGDFDKVAMQFAQASAGLQPSAVKVRPGDVAAVSQMATPSWSFGAIAPFPPFDAYSRAMLLDIAQAQIQLLPANGPDPFETASFTEAFGNSNLSLDDVQDGVGLTFVGVGAAPAMGTGAWWNAFTFAVVDSDP